MYVNAGTYDDDDAENRVEERMTTLRPHPVEFDESKEEADECEQQHKDHDRTMKLEKKNKKINPLILLIEI